MFLASKLKRDADAKKQVIHQPHGLDGARVLHFSGVNKLQKAAMIRRA